MELQVKVSKEQHKYLSDYLHKSAHFSLPCYCSLKPSEATKIMMVQDNLNTHTKGSFYEQLLTQ